MKFAPGDVPLFPPVFQKFELLNPPNVAAFTFVNPAPSPANELAVTVPEKFGLAGSELIATVPLRLLAVFAKIA